MAIPKKKPAVKKPAAEKKVDLTKPQVAKAPKTSFHFAIPVKDIEKVLESKV